MSIQFKKVELKAYPQLEKIQVGMYVVALANSDYTGLNGVVTEILYGNDKETENDSILDIYVDFQEMDYGSIESTHPHLNGTGIGQVICGEDELGFNIEESIPFFSTADGKIVCPNCYESLSVVRETQSEDITWSFKDGSYVIDGSMGTSDGKKCQTCDGTIEDPDEMVFSY